MLVPWRHNVSHSVSKKNRMVKKGERVISFDLKTAQEAYHFKEGYGMLWVIGMLNYLFGSFWYEICFFTQSKFRTCITSVYTWNLFCPLFRAGTFQNKVFSNQTRGPFLKCLLWRKGFVERLQRPSSLVCSSPIFRTTSIQVEDTILKCYILREKN